MRDAEPTKPNRRAQRSSTRSFRLGRAWFRRMERSERKKKVLVMEVPVMKSGLRKPAPMSEMKARVPASWEV